MKKSSTKIKVRYAETDAMGVVHHANYYIYFEVAREDLIKEYGISYNNLEKEGVMMPLVETHCRYVEAAKYDDYIIIEAKMSELTPIKARIEYIAKKESDGTIVARGETLQTFVDCNTFKIVNLKRTRPDLWDLFVK